MDEFFPNGLNNLDQISGSSMGAGFLLTGTIFTRLAPPGSTYGQAFGINDAGQVVGDFETSPGPHGYAPNGFLYANGSFTTIDVPGSDTTSAYDINNAGEIVGGFTGADCRATCGFIATIVPEPATAVLLATGLICLLVLRRRAAQQT